MKDWPKRGEKCGIYAIENIVDGKFYVGQAQCVRARWLDHLSKLRSGKHSNAYLKNAWSKHGEDCFRFVVLEECAKADLDAREQEWLTTLDATKHGYNISPSSSTTRGTRRSEESKEKLRKTLNSPETRARKVAAGEKMWRNPGTRDQLLEGARRGLAKPETQEKILSRLRKSWADPEVCKRRSEAKKADWSDPVTASIWAKTIRETAKRPDVRDKVVSANRKRSTTKLTQGKVDAIRKRYVSGCPTNGASALAEEFGVSKSTIRCVVSRKTWA